MVELLISVTSRLADTIVHWSHDGTGPSPRSEKLRCGSGRQYEHSISRLELSGLCGPII